ncbi:MAG: HAMP domain-containing histidine kinase [Clostridia bacterium]|nr:HAMP domain-containing histidine kinase [Clostridia bacterium]
MKKEHGEKTKKVLALIAVIIIAGIVGQAVSNIDFNSKIYTIKGAEEGEVCFHLGNRQDNTSSWVKRDFDCYGKIVDLSARTIDGTFYNKTPYEVETWKMRLNIKDDCFINNAWCGIVEIHQFVGTDKEAVQKIDLRDYKIKDIKLEYLNDGDLLIPLTKGDYIIYYPSEKDRELNIGAHSELTMGMILYFLDDIDISDFEINYKFHRSFTEGVGFYGLAVMVGLWIMIFMGYIVATISYKSAYKAMEERKSGLSYMSVIYSIIYIIDLVNDEIIVINSDPDSEMLRPKELGASEQMKNLFEWDATESYLQTATEFGDLSTLNERMEKDSIVCEYISKHYGWVQCRFFAMDRIEGEPLRKVVFAIQVVNDERRELSAIQENVSKVEAENRAKGAFLSNISYEIRNPLKSIMELDEKILAESGETTIKSYAREIDNLGRIVLSLIDGVLNSDSLEDGKITIKREKYSLKKMLKDVYTFTSGVMQEKGLSYVVDVSQNLPDMLIGDEGRIKQILLALINNASKYTKQGFVKFSVYGKSSEKKIHLLFSVKDSGGGIDDAKKERLIKQISDQGARRQLKDLTKDDLGLYLVIRLLEIMGSKLNLISSVGEGSEFYFELIQEVVDDNSMGEKNL